MPKVNVYENKLAGRVLQDDGSWVDAPPVQPRRVSVGWSRGQHAQLGVGWVDSEQTSKDVAPHVGWAADFIVNGELDEAGKVWQSQWIDLDRHSINQLIRELRKARDEAFGRDE